MRNLTQQFHIALNQFSIKPKLKTKSSNIFNWIFSYKMNTKKAFFYFLAFMGIQISIFGQNTSAIVEFASKDRGFLIPRMSTEQRMLIVSPVEGLIVYDLTLHSFFFFDGGVWKNSNGTTLTENNWNLNGNTSNELPLLGTKDNNPLIFITNNRERMRLTADGLLQFSNGSLDVGENSIIGSNLTIKRNVLLNAEEGFTLINGTSTLGGPAMNPSNFTGLVRINKTLDVNGATKLKNNLSVDGLTEINNNLRVTEAITSKEATVLKDAFLNAEDGVTIINGTTTIGGPLSNPATFTGNVKLNKNFDVLGTTKLNSTLTVNGSTNINNNLNVTETSVSKELTVKQNVLLNAEEGNTLINGTSTIGGPTMNPANFTGPVKINKTLESLGATKLKNTLSVDGSTDLNSDLNVVGTTVTKDLTAKQNVLLNAEGGNTLINGTSVLGGPLLNPTTFTGPVTMKSLELTDLLVKNTLTVRGPASFKNTIDIDGAASLRSTLNVDGATRLNSTLNVLGIAEFRNILNVFGASNLKSVLNVDGATDLNTTLNVDGITSLRSTLNQFGVANLKSNLNVDGATDLNASLNVDGTANLKNALTVDGISIFNNRLTVFKDVPNGQFLATFINGNTTNGDGIKIKLGKAKAEIIPSTPVISAAAQALADKMKNLISNGLTDEEKVTLLGQIITQGASEDVKLYAQVAVGVGNFLIDFINKKLGLPVPFGPYGVPIDFLPGPSFTIPIIPRFDLVPAIPQIDLTSIGVPPLDLTSRTFWGIPSINLNESGDPLNIQNEFIVFTDNADKKMGSITAQSIRDWEDFYLNPTFLYTLYGDITSSKMDKFHAKFHMETDATNALIAYSKIGVQYSSGNGDYAEWLERINPNEFISAGDIVGVIGGKITKDLENAEQVMSVSQNPIVLGNTPTEGKIYQGNNIAFMGQIPVKIMGPVATGDYIVGNNNTPGYGIAKNPKDMTLEDFKHAVGRSWENKESDGPMMVNTVVGIHNGDYLKILKKYEEKFKQTELRFDSLELKVDVLIDKLKVKEGN